MAGAPGDDAGDVLTAVQTHWDTGPVSVTILPGGMNSTTWTVTSDRVGRVRRWVAKLVTPLNRESFLRGLDVATDLERAGISAGAPEPTRTGRLFLDTAHGVLALLRWVDGHPLTGDEDGQTSIGGTLGRVHAVLRTDGPRTARSAREFPSWMDADAAHLDVEEWVRPAVRTARARYRELLQHLLDTTGRGPTWGRLHADPEPGAFLRSAGRRDCGLIDWSSSVEGPLLYDLASAVLYVGGPERAGALVDAYATTDVLSAPEIAAGLDVLLDVRWAVQADYFARRLAVDDLTGLEHAGENVTGLHDARGFFLRERGFPS